MDVSLVLISHSLNRSNTTHSETCVFSYRKKSVVHTISLMYCLQKMISMGYAKACDEKLSALNVLILKYGATKFRKSLVYN